MSHRAAQRHGWSTAVIADVTASGQRLRSWRGRQRVTSSLCVRQAALLRTVIAATQGTALGPFVTPQTFELADARAKLASGRREYEDGARFFGHFEGRFTLEHMRDRVVLDLGCGYGGRTVYYARHGHVREIHGIDISEEMARRCRRLADELNAPQVAFEVGRAEMLPYPDASFDLVISYDVMEHVDDPARSLLEVARVLRPGGTAWMVFPTYLGALSSHLDYLTRIPALHRVFDPATIIDVVNEFLAAEPERLGVAPQPPPRVTVVGREALPSLNGMCVSDAREYVNRTGLDVSYERLAPIFYAMSKHRWIRTVSGPFTYVANRWRLPELLIWNISLGLEKPLAA